MKQEYELLEEEFARYTGVRYASACNSGTSALTLALAALDVGPGDEVIVPDFTMIATAWAVTYRGAGAVFCPPGDDWNMDISRIEDLITNHTKAIIVTHVYGRMADMPKICQIARDYGLYVIEDACEAHGAYRSGRSGSWGDIGCFSFYRNKIVHAEEGGICTTNNTLYKQRMDYLRSMAMDGSGDYTHREMGYNFRMPNGQAKMARVSLKKIDANIKRRKEIANIYGSILLDYPTPLFGNGDVYWVYPVENTFYGLVRDLATTRAFFQPIHLQAPYHEPTFEVRNNGFYITIDENATDDEAEKVAEGVKKLLHG